MREAIEYNDPPEALRSLFEQLRSTTGADMDALFGDTLIRAAMASDMNGDMDQLARDLHELRVANEMDVEPLAVRAATWRHACTHTPSPTRTPQHASTHMRIFAAHQCICLQ